LELETTIDPVAGPILGDPARLHQIVTNLLSNAIKFTPNGGKIEVRLARTDAHVRLEAKDTGIGIAAEHLPHVFERFRQVDSSTIRMHGGLGLGLAIVEYLVRQQGGTVCAESEGVGKGATFSVEFPLMSSEVRTVDFEDGLPRQPQSKSMSVCSEPSQDQSLRQRRILLVEDDPDTQELLKTILESHGADVAIVSSSKQALTELERTKPDIIISDIGMAGENGYDMIRKVRSLEPEQGGRIPAIALTAYAGASDRRQALLAGFQTHLSKPVNAEGLVAVIVSLTFRNEIRNETEQGS
jgi:CheY-like chemotaxis protein